MSTRVFIESFNSGLRSESLKKLLRIKPNFPKPPVLESIIQLPGQNTGDHTGFVNCANNQIGLNADFYNTKCGNVGLLWSRSKRGQDGYPGLLHGGISASLVDELTQCSLFVSKGVFGVTVKLSTSFLKPIRIGETVTGLAKTKYIGNDFVTIEAYLFRSDGKVAVQAEATFYLPNIDQFKSITGIKSIPNELQTCFKKK